jgi:DNA-binding MltR family transcriptional regulator
MAKKCLPKGPHQVDEAASRFFETLKAESDRGCALVVAAFLDEALELLLRSRMSSDATVVKKSMDPLFTGVGPLMSFWAKTELCRALNLLDDWEYRDLTSIRSVRNLLAHSYNRANFSDARVVEIVARLHKFRRVKFSPDDVRRNKEARLKFLVAASWLAGTLQHRTDHPRP